MTVKVVRSTSWRGTISSNARRNAPGLRTVTLRDLGDHTEENLDAFEGDEWIEIQRSIGWKDPFVGKS
ncbi:MAG: hypothetical protein GY856_53685 [bacterium]|nr:hypothetical protein [bacterium]